MISYLANFIVYEAAFVREHEGHDGELESGLGWPRPWPEDGANGTARDCRVLGMKV